MKQPEKPTPTDELRLLREGIKRRYAHYHATNRDKYPTFDFNSNRTNYQPLRESFEEEFFEHRQLDRLHNHLHIPSLSTLAQLFTNDEYVPTRKIAYTCRSYAQPDDLPPAPPQAEVAVVPVVPAPKRRPVWLVALVGITLLALIAGGYWLLILSPQKLAIRNLTTGQVVPRLLRLTGTAPPNAIVWVLVHPVAPNEAYYLQDPIVANADGTWAGPILIGRADHQSDGVSFEVRAFTNSDDSYTKKRIDAGQAEFASWPTVAEQATEPYVVVRSAKE